jgi:hypothetical protein
VTPNADKVRRGPDGRFLSADCEKACQHRCAYRQFSECEELSPDGSSETPFP